LKRISVTFFLRPVSVRIDRDTMKHIRDFERVFGGFRKGEIDILVGTQMIAKGHDFPLVTLVGVLAADAALSLPDFRAAERTFQLLTPGRGPFRQRRSSGRSRDPEFLSGSLYVSARVHAAV
jgi:primosomal protein N' (replication factor Y)